MMISIFLIAPHTSSLPLLLPAAIRFPLSSMAHTELSQSAVACVPAVEAFSWGGGPPASPKLGLLWSLAPEGGEEEAEEGDG